MTTPGITDSLVYKNLPLIAITGLAVLAKISAVAIPIVLAPLAVNVTLTEFALSKMNAFKLSPNQIAIVLASLLILTIATIVTAFVFLPLPIAFIFAITALVVCINNFNRLDQSLDREEGGYIKRYKTMVSKEESAFKSKIEKLIVEADDKMRAENEELLIKLNAFAKSSSGLPLEFKAIDNRYQEIVTLTAEISKLSASA